jgi:hypothetical protein
MRKVVRKRWVIIKNGEEIFCGISRKYHFRPLADVGNACIKTYMSKNQAISSFERSNIGCTYDDVVYRAVEIVELIQINLF